MIAFSARQANDTDTDIPSFPTIPRKLPLSFSAERRSSVDGSNRALGNPFRFSAASSY